jgi:hypothetical protein
MTGLPPEVVILNDPELAMADDPLPMAPGGTLVVIGNWQKEYPSIGAMIFDRDHLEIELDKHVTPEQRAVEPEAWIVRRFVPDDGPEFTIYGHLFTIGQAVEREAAHGSGVLENARWRKRLGNARDRGWLWGKFYSRITPEGETGVIHRAMITATLTEAEFLASGERGWPKLFIPEVP